jgi:hypothetical protein
MHKVSKSFVHSDFLPHKSIAGLSCVVKCAAVAAVVVAVVVVVVTGIVSGMNVDVGNADALLLTLTLDATGVALYTSGGGAAAGSDDVALDGGGGVGVDTGGGKLSPD